MSLDGLDIVRTEPGTGTQSDLTTLQPTVIELANTPVTDTNVEPITEATIAPQVEFVAPSEPDPVVEDPVIDTNVQPITEAPIVAQVESVAPSEPDPVVEDPVIEEVSAPEPEPEPETPAYDEPPPEYWE